MRYKVQAYLWGLFFYLGIVMLFPLLWAIADLRNLLSFVIPSAISIIAGFLLRYKKYPGEYHYKESFTFVALAWPVAAH